MTLQSSGTISFDNLRTERAVGGAISLGDMYREGSKTPVSPGTTGIPTSGAISVSNFYGKTLYGNNFITFVAGQLLDAKTANTGIGYSEGNTLFSGQTVVGSVASGTMQTGSGFRVIINAYAQGAGRDPQVFMAIGGSLNPGDNADSSDIDGDNNANRIQGKVMTLRNGAGTSGSVVFSQNIQNRSGVRYGITVNTSMYSQAANQTDVCVCSTNSTSTTITSGNTYTLQIS